jgi:hypothetical protein
MWFLGTQGRSMPSGKSLLLVVSMAFLAVGCGGGDAVDEPSSADDGSVEQGPAPSAEPREPVPVRRTYALEWVSNDVPPVVRRGTKVPVHITVRNTGNWPWPDPKTPPAEPSGGQAVRLVHNWVAADGKAGRDFPRTDLAAPVPPGGSVTLTFDLVAPSSPGDYRLELALVEELVAWFDARGAQKLVIPVKVV